MSKWCMPKEMPAQEASVSVQGDVSEIRPKCSGKEKGGKERKCEKALVTSCMLVLLSIVKGRHGDRN